MARISNDSGIFRRTSRRTIAIRAAARVTPMVFLFFVSLMLRAQTITSFRPLSENTGLPVIKIDTENGAAITDKENYVSMTFTLTDPDHPDNNVSSINTLNGIRARGNDSWTNPNALKKSYRIKFDKKTSLFGLEAAKSWVLIAQYRDPTLLFNVIAFELGNRFEIPFNHSFNFVELYLNGEYKGNYLLTEPNQVNPGRVDINEKEGWLVEMDWYYDKEPKFITTNYELPVMIKSPEIEPVHINNPAYNFVKKDINELCNSLASAGFPENGYRDLINMNTFIDFMMINEIVDNKEIESPMSTFMYKNKNDVINMGPLWDFDCGYGYGYNYIHFKNPDDRTPIHSFFMRLLEDPVFLMKYKERWNEKYSDITSMSDFIDATANRIEVSAIENFKTWWYRVISSWWTLRYPKEENDFWQQISNIKNYLNEHISYLNTELNKIEVLPKRKIFATQPSGYSKIASQIFTLVAYGDMTNLSASFRKAGLSDFEISDEISKMPAEKGGYWATISVKPKGSLPVGTYSDVLILSGNNQGEQFYMEVPMSFVVVRGINSTGGDIQQANPLKAWVQNGLLHVSGLNEGKVWSVYNTSGALIYRGIAYSNTAEIALNVQGVYIVQSGDNTIKVVFN